MGIEIWNKNAKEGRIEEAKIRAEVDKSKYRSDVDMQSAKSEALTTIARTIGEVLKALISSRGKKE